MRNIGDMSNFKMNVGYVNVYLKDATTRAIKQILIQS
jgi:hypothetical protein